MWHIRFGKVRGSQHLNMLLSPMSCFVINADTPYANNHFEANLFLVVQQYFYRCNRDTHFFVDTHLRGKWIAYKNATGMTKCSTLNLKHSIKFVVYVKIVFTNSHVIWNVWIYYISSRFHAIPNGNVIEVELIVTTDLYFSLKCRRNKQRTHWMN